MPFGVTSLLEERQAFLEHRACLGVVGLARVDDSEVTERRRASPDVPQLTIDRQAFLIHGARRSIIAARSSNQRQPVQRSGDAGSIAQPAKKRQAFAAERRGTCVLTLVVR